MYRELIISTVIIILIFIFDFITQSYTDKVINSAIQDLCIIKEKINEKEIRNEELVGICNKKYFKWLEYHKLLAFYIEHNELEKVETNYVTGKSFIETNNYEDAISEFEKTIFVMKHINDKYSVKLENIF